MDKVFSKWVARLRGRSPCSCCEALLISPKWAHSAKMRGPSHEWETWWNLHLSWPSPWTWWKPSAHAAHAAHAFLGLRWSIAIPTYLLRNVHKEKPFAGTAGEGCGFPAFINEPSVPQQSCAMWRDADEGTKFSGLQQEGAPPLMTLAKPVAIRTEAQRFCFLLSWWAGSEKDDGKMGTRCWSHARVEPLWSTETFSCNSR